MADQIVRKRDEEMKWNGWGYKDTYFYMEDDQIHFADSGRNHLHIAQFYRYNISGQTLPSLRDIADEVGMDSTYLTPAQPLDKMEQQIPDPIRNEQFMGFLDEHAMKYSFEKRLRLARAHGQGIAEIYHLRFGKIDRIPDVVVWPNCHDDVVALVAAANANNVAIIPIGGGTSVTLGLQCPANENRMIVSLDLGRMNRILWIDRDNLVARAEAGCIGMNLENELNNEGFTLGHEPDSIEVSTLGGWVATRASGMKRAKYGNIEDMVVHIKIVTPAGVLEKNCYGPRISGGPDIHHFILGSEGTLGVITEITFRICKKPEARTYACVVFPNFESGLKCMREIVDKKCVPASMRLLDNRQFQIRLGYKKGQQKVWQTLGEHLKQFYVESIKGFDLKQACTLPMLFEGTKEEVKSQEKRVMNIATSYGGFAAGKATGQYCYNIIYAIIYLRDFGLNHGCMGDAFETSMPWDKVLTLCNNVKKYFQRESEKLGAKYAVMCRVTQAYDLGACIYIYYVMNFRNVKNPIEEYCRIEDGVREVMIASGGSISHHHGVGKLRAKFLPATVGEVGITAMRGVKQALDPKNIFASGNLFEPMSKI